MNYIQRTFVAVTTSSLLWGIPFSMFACGPVQDTSAIFETPVLAKGRFVYAHKVSRRTLRTIVALSQQPYRPALPKMEL